MFPQDPPSIYQSSKCFVTYGTMAQGSPPRGKPWTLISALDFIQKVDLIVPQDLYETVRRKISEREVPSFFKVSMTLAQVLETGFLTEYIKRGNFLMLSEGNTTSTNMFTLRDGQLDMYLDRETFERAGLEGKPHGVKGNRGSKPRWKVTYDLRSPSMLHGKKGFDRLVYASKNVLNQQLDWLIFDQSKSPPKLDNLDKLAATRMASTLQTPDCTGIPQIPFQLPAQILSEEDGRRSFEEVAIDWYEWLSLVRLQSPRVRANDAVDTYLSRYRVPGGEQTGTQMQVCMLSWQGFLASSWLRDLLVDVLSVCPSRSWLAVSATTFPKSVVGNCDEVAFLRLPEKPDEFIVWEIKSTE